VLRELHLRNTGPSPQLDAEFAERLNVFTGDNGLGKSFLLDVVWWTLTQTWSGYPAAPSRAPQPESQRPPRSTIQWQRTDADIPSEQEYDIRMQRWGLSDGTAISREKPPKTIVIYSRVDGGISVWDPSRNQWPNGLKIQDFSPHVVPPGRLCFHFTRENLWNGLKDTQDRPICNGLIHDWVFWQLQERSEAEDRPFDMLCAVLAELSPSSREQLTLGKPVRVFRDDPRDFPTLVFPHGIVPVIHASAGMRRILSLAYALVWAWHEHRQAAALANEAPLSSIVFLIDEVEAHLHPQWQRRILPALLRVLAKLLNADMHVQLMATTHSPLVLASLEPHFDPERDRVFHFGLEDNRVTLQEEHWAKEGDVDSWLKSDTFGLQQARSIEAERAIEAAKAWIRGDLSELPPDLGSEAAIEAELRRVLPPGDDEFWPRWIIHTRGTRAP
jgi:hypothetical protein